MFGLQPEFSDRREAGRGLAAALEHFKPAHPLVLALPRGGVPVAFEVARALGADLDLLIVRKLGAPGHEELGIGALVDGAAPHIVLNEEIYRQLSPSPTFLRAEIQRQLREIERQRRTYLGDTPPISPMGRTVIVVDDGIATGGTIRAALEGVREAHPTRLVLAVPVAPVETLAALRPNCDEIVCLYRPEPFFAVSAHYRAFDQISDAEVIALLRAARTFA